jgi:hypothetical protein
MQRSAFLLVLAAASALASPALAQDAEPSPAAPDKPTAPPVVRIAPGYVPDSVYLKEGGLLRGAIVENLPHDHVTIALPTGEVRRVPWNVVERVETNGHGAQSAPAPAAPKEGPLVKVHISGDDTVLLDRRPAGQEAWVPACSAPCDEDLPLGDDYRISGPGLRSSSQFRLEGAPGGRIDVNVNPKTKTSWWVGAGVGGMGLVIDVYALYFVALGAAMMSQPCSTDYYGTHSCGDDRSAGQGLRNVGLVMLIPGTVAAIVGGGMMLANWRTGITQSSSESATASKPLDAFKRSAEFRGPQAAAPGAPGFFTPIFSAKF